MTQPDVYEFVSEVLGVNRCFISDDTSYQSIAEWDSLKHVNLMMKLEYAYGVKINEKDILKLTSVKAIHHFIQYAKVSHEKEESNQQKIHRGLNGIYFDNTSITCINGEQGKLLYRGYPIDQLVAASNYEEVCYLLLFGHLPTLSALSTFKANLFAERSLSDATLSFIRTHRELSPLNLIKAILAMYTVFEKRQTNTQQAGIALLAKLPLIIGQHQRERLGLAMYQKTPPADLAAYFLLLLHDSPPHPRNVSALQTLMMLQADHGANASSFVARTVTSTQATIYSAILSAICAFSGPLHGGALAKVIIMLDEIHQPEAAAHYINQRLEAGAPVYGFGHRVYRTLDPRAKLMRGLAKDISIANGDTRYFDILEAIHEAMQRHAKYGLHPNVDLYASVIYHFLGIPHDMFVAVFAMSRLVGWIAQIHEQENNNILIRPRLHYTGREHDYVSIENRSTTTCGSECLN